MYRCDSERFQCTHCEESFVTNYNRKRHLENLALSTCGECGKEFKGERGMKYHMKQIHSGRNVKVECKQCKGLFREPYIKSHIKIFHSSEKLLEETHKKGPRFECKTCGSEFDRKTNFEKHMKKHSSKNTKKQCLF